MVFRKDGSRLIRPGYQSESTEIDLAFSREDRRFKTGGRSTFSALFCPAGGDHSLTITPTFSKVHSFGKCRCTLSRANPFQKPSSRSEGNRRAGTQPQRSRKSARSLPTRQFIALLTDFLTVDFRIMLILQHQGLCPSCGGRRSCPRGSPRLLPLVTIDTPTQRILTANLPPPPTCPQMYSFFEPHRDFRL